MRSSDQAGTLMRAREAHKYRPEATYMHEPEASMCEPEVCTHSYPQPPVLTLYFGRYRNIFTQSTTTCPRGELCVFITSPAAKTVMVKRMVCSKFEASISFEYNSDYGESDNLSLTTTTQQV